MEKTLSAWALRVKSCDVCGSDKARTDYGICLTHWDELGQITEKSFSDMERQLVTAREQAAIAMGRALAATEKGE